MIDWIVDKWLTWRTGKDKQTRLFESWYEVSVVRRASTIENMFMHFKYVIEVDYEKFFNMHEPFGWVVNKDVEQYCYPNRELGNNIVWRWERVYWNQWEQRWYISDFGEADKVFVATNNEDDAIMLSLRYT